jgi:hypothetical protein
VTDHSNTKRDVIPEQEVLRGTRELSPAQLLAWADGTANALRLRTYRDVIPGGFLAALVPARVEWKSSDPHGDDPFVIIRNVNYGGNPFDKTTVLHRVRIPLNGIAFVELTLVPSTRGGLHALAHHAQLRFVFKAEKRPVLLSLADSAAGSDASIPDLVLSWEIWQESRVRYSGFKGLDAASYRLSMRAYAGPQRFLEDTLHGRDWFSYRVRMPGGQQGSAELLKVVLALGDGVANDTVSSLLDRSEEEALKHAPTGDTDAPTASEVQKLREHFLHSREIKDPNMALSHEQGGYQTLVRSCATLARYSILTATNRLIRGGVTEGMSLDAVPKPLMGEPAKWMEKIAHANLKGMFIRAPLALAYIIRHPEAVPDKIPIELAEAGLMEKREGKAWVVKYSHKGNKPYDSSGMCGLDHDS